MADAEAPSRELLERLRRVRLVLMDVDGVLTDGRLYLFSDGSEGRAFHARDGHGVRMGRAAGLEFGILSGRSSPLVAARAEELGFTEVHQGVADKAARFEEVLARRALPREAVCYVGDDVVDVPVLRRAGLAVAPADADEAARSAAHWVTAAKGGEGAVREVVEELLRAQEAREGIARRHGIRRRRSP